MVLVVLAAWKLTPSTHTFTADFANASGISSGDSVRVAGIDVGKVRSVRLHRGVVHVEFTADKDVAVTRNGRAEIKLATILGQHYLDRQHVRARDTRGQAMRAASVRSDVAADRAGCL